MTALASILTDFARHRSAANLKKFYLAEKMPDYAKVYRIAEAGHIDSWHAFWYTKNDSPFQLRETITPQLEGATVVWPIPN